MNKKIEKIYNLFLAMEKKQPNHGFSDSDMNLLKDVLFSLKEEKSVEAQKIYSIYFHLNSQMSLQEFSNWLIPVERYLKKDLKDEDFLVFNKDHFDRKEKTETLPLVIILDHVRSSFNVGSIFRTSEAFNLEKIYLVGYTPDPTNAKTNKTTLGAHEFIPWETVPKVMPLIENLKNQGYQVIAAETTSHAIPIDSPIKNAKVAMIFGNERFGLDPEVIAACDETRILNLKGYKNSLNIANCASIFIYEFYKQWKAHV